MVGSSTIFSYLRISASKPMHRREGQQTSSVHGPGQSAVYGYEPSVKCHLCGVVYLRKLCAFYQIANAVQNAICWNLLPFLSD